MNKTVARLPWWAALALVGLLLTWVAGCRNNETQPLVQPAVDRPTLVWIFSDP